MRLKKLCRINSSVKSSYGALRVGGLCPLPLVYLKGVQPRELATGMPFDNYCQYSLNISILIGLVPYSSAPAHW